MTRHESDTFAATRSWQRGWFWLGLGLFALCVGGLVLSLALVGAGAADLAPWLLFVGAFAWMVTGLLAVRPRPATLALEGGALVASWRKRPLVVREVVLGRWVLAGVDTTIGLVAHVRGDGGALRIGGKESDGEGYTLGAAPARSVDCTLAPADFTRCLSALGVVRDDVRVHLLQIPLTRNRLTFGGALGGMWPWLLTIVACAGYGFILDRTGLDSELMRRPGGTWILGGIAMAIVLLGLTLTIVRASRVRRAAFELHADAITLALVRKDGKRLAAAPWSAVHGLRQRYHMRTRSGTTILPALELVIGDHAPLRLALWDPASAWSEDVPRAKTPRLLIGVPEWRRLVALLRQHQRLA